MEDILAHQFVGLGQDLRKQNLINLVRCLTHQEVRDLKTALFAVDMRTDIISRLPPELRLLIARQLGQDDAFHLLNVSRQWRYIWLQPDMLSSVFQSWRGIDRALPNGRSDGILNPEHWTAVRYESLCRRRRRFLGWCQGATVVQHDVGDGHGWLNSGLELEGVYQQGNITDSNFRTTFIEKASASVHISVRSSLYGAGRIAWVPDSQLAPANDFVVVEDLCSMAKKILRAPSVSQYGTTLELKALGDKLVVAGTSRVMYIWHLDTNESAQVFLPQQPSCCITRGEHVAFVRRDSAFLWKWGGNLRTLDLRPLLECNERVVQTWPSLVSSNSMGLFFHPSEEGTLFVSICFIWIRQVVVHRFAAAGYQGAQEFSLRDASSLSHLSFQDPPGFVADRGTISCEAIRPVNSFGDFAVAEWRTFSPGKPFAQGVQTTGPTYIELRFNVNACEFSVKEKSLRDGSWVDMTAADLGTASMLPSWNDQMIFGLETDQIFEGAGTVAATYWHQALVALPFCSRTAGFIGHTKIHSLGPARSRSPGYPPSCIPHVLPYWLYMDRNRDGMTRTTSIRLVTEEDQRYTLNTHDDPRRTWHVLHQTGDFVLDMSRSSEFFDRYRNGGRGIHGPQRIFQDDDFIVLVHRNGYIAWNFRTTALPEERDPNNYATMPASEVNIPT